jgi:hypothetical protein
MDQLIKEILRIVKSMEKENCVVLMDQFIKVILRMVNILVINLTNCDINL